MKLDFCMKRLYKIGKMLNKEILIKDLDDICRQTDAQWLCCQDVYTENILKNEEKFVSVFRQAGLSKTDVLLRGYATLEYGGGLAFNYQDVIGGGYTVTASEERIAPVVFAGFETDFDQITIYHECGHLYQRKHNFFETKTIPYRKYLKEVHANVFASMVVLLRASDVLSFKQQQICCLASDIQTFNQKAKKDSFYISLPVTLQLVKAVRKEGRAEMLEKFSRNGSLDFEKIAFYTADLVKKHAYTSQEFYQISHNMESVSYDLLKQKSKAWHMLGEHYVLSQIGEQKEREKRYKLIKEQRRAQTEHKLKPLPEIDEKAKVINAVCAVDILNTRLNQDFGVYGDLCDTTSKNTYYLGYLKDEAKRNEAEKICGEIAEIYQKWRKNLFFKKLFSKISHPDTRDCVWDLKLRREREIFQKPEMSKQY